MALGRRRDAILSAAADEFARYGFAGARIERIAAAAAVNKQLIFHYFRSKDGLYAAVTAAVFGTWPPLSDTLATSPSERLRQLITSLVGWLGDHPGAARAIADTGATGQVPVDPAAPPSESAAWLSNAVSSVRSAVEGGQRQGYFRDDADPVAVAQIVTGCAVGHAITAGAERETAPTDAARLAANLSQAMVEYCSWR